MSGYPNHSPQIHGNVSEEYVRCIREEAAKGTAMRDLQRLFPKLKRAALYAIVLRTAWRHVR